ncbi:hypothetical protein [Flavisolibacter ginsengisoli]|jgi:hypothetical protein|uniref:Uncharacterized protein n=1 Tax=Flavisolibacter ginsengisoli DSM 18119 TaxID=1121884 RepID=A0A1M4TFB6_9BACT|nr:hypothetical protein [Flavisolibacter ginsengisoli]SHE43146.1 hypothetical protein SAMN02745131_00437 [Flavisolibacter ginsengisoli DSM 18119]
MQKFILTALTILTATISYGQSSEDLNNKSKELLDKQDFKNAIPLIKQAAKREMQKLNTIMV